MNMRQWREQRMRALAAGQTVTKQFRAELAEDSKTDLYIYDVIDPWGGYWGVSAQDVVQALQGVGDVTVHINSPGGDVFEALAIYAQFRQHAGTVTMRIEGHAASAASFIAMAGDQVVIEPQGMVMIHDAWSIEVGDAAAMQKMADLLDKTSQNIATIYHGKMGGDLAAIRTAMKETTWYAGQEAVDAGLVDAVTEPAASTALAASVEFANAWDRDSIAALYAQTPRLPTAQPGPAPAAAVPAAAAGATTTIPDGLWAQFRAATERMTTR